MIYIWYKYNRIDVISIFVFDILILDFLSLDFIHFQMAFIDQIYDECDECDEWKGV